jgi:hypothetical protein
MNTLNIYVQFFCALREACLFANLEKCTFCTDQVAFLGYVVIPKGIVVDSCNSQIASEFSWTCMILSAFHERFQQHCCTSQLLDKEGCFILLGCCTRLGFSHPHRQADSCTTPPNSGLW